MRQGYPSRKTCSHSSREAGGGSRLTPSSKSPSWLELFYSIKVRRLKDGLADQIELV